MEIVGRLTQDAKLDTLSDERTVLHFSVAVNDSYKPKGSERIKIATFFNCSYWKNTGLSNYMKKGTLVELSGRVGLNAWIDSNGEAKASLTFLVNTIKLHGKPLQADTPLAGSKQTSQTKDDEPENLPF